MAIGPGAHTAPKNHAERTGQNSERSRVGPGPNGRSIRISEGGSVPMATLIRILSQDSGKIQDLSGPRVLPAVSKKSQQKSICPTLKF